MMTTKKNLLRSSNLVLDALSRNVENHDDNNEEEVTTVN